ncbi:amino acid adenylation domain-containing protein [Crocosphaera sp. Alani8]|uniref:amino acid adenylation domain-containing protein n=1 Tax=Crocosphaera sp. Alani8 TaxID=3038952 RepID=UPI00313BE3E7
MKPNNIQDIYKLSPTQQGLLFHAVYDPESSIYCNQGRFTLKGNINVSAFKQAWQSVVDRHTILRTCFFWEEVKEPVQVVYRKVTLKLEQLDWQGIDSITQEEKLDILLKADQSRPYQLSKPPLMRLTLIQLDEDVYEFIWNNHHIIFDGWSRVILIKEVLEIYKALNNSKQIELEPSFPYRKYIGWLQEQDSSESENFWRQELQGITAPTPLPVDKFITSVSDTNQYEKYGQEQINLSQEKTEQLKSLARQNQLTLNTMIQGVWALLLSRYSGEEDIVFGAISSGRPINLPGVNSAVGLFINNLPVRVKVIETDKLIPWLKALQTQQANARRYEWTPLKTIQEWSEIPKGTPLFNSVIAFENFPINDALSQENETFKITNCSGVGQNNYPLNIFVVPMEELSLEIVYDLHYFDPVTIKRMVGHLETLLSAIVANPQQSLSDLPLLSEAEREQLLSEWNQTTVNYAPLCIHQIFENQVEKTPHAVAVEFEEQKLTYEQLNSKANQLAYYLRSLGVKPEVLVGICVERSLEMVIGLLAILKAGGAYVPLDPNYPQQRIKFILQESQLPLLLTQASLIEVIPEYIGQLVYIDKDSADIAQQSQENIISEVTTDNLAYTIYTSGSTGKPKGVQIPHSALSNFLFSMKETPGLTEQDTLLAVTTYSFDIAALELFLPLIVGAHLVIAPQEIVADGKQLLAKLTDSKTTVMQATPATWKLLIAAGWQGNDKLKILCGGEALPPQLARELLPRSGSLWNMYGPTETTIWSAVSQIKSDSELIPIGHGIANTQLYILDQSNQPVPVGVVGELCIGGVGLARGYLNRPELTQEKFIQNPFNNQKESRIYRTGDLARYLGNGDIEYLGRIDNQVKIRGFRIELGEIETQIAKYGAVKEGVVIAREDQAGDKRLVTYVVAQKELGINPSELREFLGEKLPSYMIPSAFVRLEELPLTPNGKIDRKALPAPQETALSSEEIVLPSTPMEEILAGIWSEILGIEKVGVNSNFFELGGHSLIATRLMSQIRQTFKVDIPLRNLFEKPTIAQLAKEIEQATVIKPQQEFSDLPLLSESEQHQLLSEWNETKVEYSSLCVHQLFEVQVEKTPDAVAVEFENQKLTYRELNTKANQLAHYLRSLGVSLGVLVGIYFEPSVELLVSLLGVLKAHGVYVPLDPNYPQERLAYMLEDSNVPILLTQEQLISKIPHQQAQIICLDRDKDIIDQQSRENLTSDATLDDLAYVIYTSGSSGRPKGVLGKIRGLVNRLHWMWEKLPFADDEVCAQKTSISFVDHVAEIFSPLLQGIPLIIVPDKIRGDVLALMNLLKEKNITRIVLVPSLLKAMIHSSPEKLSELHRLKYVFCSGEALPLSLAEEFHKNLGSARLFNLYGSSEVTADVTYFEVNFWETGQKILEYFKPELVLGASEDRNVSPHHKPFTQPGVNTDILAKQFQRSELPSYPVTVDRYYTQLSQEVLPYVIDTSSPTFIGHMTSALPDFLHDMSKLISQLNQNLVKIETSKSLLFLEREAIAMLHRLVYGFSEEFYTENIQQKNSNLGIVTTGGTTANISALLCARNAGLLRQENSSELLKESLYKILMKKGYEDIVIIGSRLMHYSLDKASSMLGLGTNNIIFIDSNSEGNLDIEQLEETIQECRKNHLFILAIVGIAGATETGQVDPLSELGDIAQKFNIHFHVDGAWGGPTVFSDKHKGKLKGIEKADSVTICGHKQLYLPQGISVCLFKDPELLNFTATTARYQAQRDTYDVGRFTIEGSRSALSLCLHGALHIIGKKGYEILIDNGIEKAQYFARLIDRLEQFELIMQPALNIVNYRYIPDDLREKVPEKSLSDDEIQRINQLNQKIQEEQFSQGRTFVSKTTLLDPAYEQEIVVFRTVLSNPNTTATDLHSVLEDNLRIAYQIQARNQEQFGSQDKVLMPEIDSGDTEITGIEKKGIYLRFTEDPNADIEEYLKKNTIPIGKPINNTQIYILDKNGNLLPKGLTGELYIGGDGLAQGYLNLPELTKEKFIPNPFSQNKQDKLYRTGDLARWLPNGNIEFVGRIDRQVKIKGFRIELGEIEAILNNHPQVKETVVITTERLPNEKRLVAYIISEDNSLSFEELSEFLRENLPEYMIPTVWVPLEELPLNPNGKVDRKALPIPDQVDTISETIYVAPCTPVEELIVSIWQEELNVKPIGIHDNFFELGGHSLIAAQIVSKLRQTVSIELSLQSLFENPTVSQLAQKISLANNNLDISQIKSITRQGDLPLSFTQQRLWFLDQLEGANAAYNLFGGLRLIGELDFEALSKSINAIIERHESLRTTFEMKQGQPVQIINDSPSGHYLDVKILEINQNSNIQELIDQEIRNPFDLSKDSLIRVSIIPLEKYENILLLTMHHIISDAWSIEIFIKEFLVLYQSYIEDKNPILPTLKVQYADYANWQQELSHQEIFQKQLEYWKNQLENSSSYLNLPFDNPRSSVQNYQGTEFQFSLSSELTTKIKQFSQQEKMTVFMTMLTAFHILLYCYSGDEDICVGSPIANRQQQETRNMIGFFVNTLVLRIKFSQDDSLQDILQQVRKISLNAYSNQEIPFDRIVNELNIERTLQYNPLFQVWFVLNESSEMNLKLPKLDWEAIKFAHGLVRHDLTLRIAEEKGKFLGIFQYKTSLFNSDTIDLMSKHYNLVANYLVNQSSICLSEIKEEIATDKEHKKREKEEKLLSNVRQKLKRRKRK